MNLKYDTKNKMWNRDFPKQSMIAKLVDDAKDFSKLLKEFFFYNYEF